MTKWAAYDIALRQRGSLTVWFTEAAMGAWKAEPRATRGGQPRYSAVAITTALTLRAVFRLALPPLVAAKGRRRRSRHCGSARFLLLGKPFHRAGLPYGFGGLRFVALLGGFCVPAVQLKYTFALHRLDQQFAERPYQGINAGPANTPLRRGRCPR